MAQNFTAALRAEPSARKDTTLFLELLVCSIQIPGPSMPVSLAWLKQQETDEGVVMHSQTPLIHPAQE